MAHKGRPNQAGEPERNQPVHTASTSRHQNESETRESGSPDLYSVPTHRSMGYEVPVELPRHDEEDSDVIFDRLSDGRKRSIVALLSFCALLSSIATASLFSASPEIASEYDTTMSMINISNAMYTLSMALSPLFWGPMSQLYGRRWVSPEMNTSA